MITTIVLAVINYALAGLNVYLWAFGSEFGAANLGTAVFAIGAAHTVLQIEGWKHQR